MFGNLIDGSQNTVWHFALEGEILQSSKNRSNTEKDICLLTKLVFKGHNRQLTIKNRIYCAFHPCQWTM